MVVEPGEADAIRQALGVKPTGEKGRSEDFSVSARQLPEKRYLVLFLVGTLKRRMWAQPGWN